MGIAIHPVGLSFAQSYVVQSEEASLVDCGLPGSASRVLGNIERLSLEPEQIRLIVITHGYWDHVGSARPRGAKRSKGCTRKAAGLCPSATSPSFPDEWFYRGDYPSGHCYLKSEWKAALSVPAVLLEKRH